MTWRKRSRQRGLRQPTVCRPRRKSLESPPRFRRGVPPDGLPDPCSHVFRSAGATRMRLCGGGGGSPNLLTSKPSPGPFTVPGAGSSSCVRSFASFALSKPR